jgi:ribosomal protein L7/L12
LWAAGGTFGLLVVVVWQIGRASATASRVERKLDELLIHSGMDWTAIAGREVLDLVRAGRKIEAIKHYREMTGAGLAEAKVAIERMQ